MQGKIIKGIAGFYYIYAQDGNVYECKAKGIFRKDNFKPLVGDNAEISVLDQEAKEGSVTAILPRRNSLIRPAVANVDQAFVIFAMEDPKPNFLLLDRFLIMMEQQGIPAVICFNKKDLGEKEELERYLRRRGHRRDPSDPERKDNRGSRSFRSWQIFHHQLHAG